MSVENAKQKLNRQAGEPTTGYVQAADIQASYDDLQDGWQADIAAAGGGGGGVSQAELDAAVAPKADKTYVDQQDALLVSPAELAAATAGKADKTYVDAQDSALDARIDTLEAGGGGGGVAVGSAYLSGATSANLSGWIAARNAGVGGIMAIGTSHPYGWGTTNPGTDAWPWQLAAKLGATRGMEPLNKFSTEIANKRDYIATVGVGRNYDATIADNGSLDLIGAGTSITYNAKGCTSFRAITRDWGASCQVSVDGGAPTTTPSANNSNTPILRTLATFAEGDHSVKVYDSVGADPDLRFAAMGGHGPGLVVHNFGVPGSQSINWRSNTGTTPPYMQDGTVSKPEVSNSNAGTKWASLPNSVGVVQPDLLLIQIGGGNDTRDAIDPPTYGTQLDYLIKWTRGQHSGMTPRHQSIIALTPFGEDATSIALRNEMLQACADNDVPVFDVNALIPDNSPLWTGDGHITTPGHTLIADEVKKAIVNPLWVEPVSKEYVDAADSALDVRIDALEAAPPPTGDVTKAYVDAQDEAIWDAHDSLAMTVGDVNNNVGGLDTRVDALEAAQGSTVVTLTGVEPVPPGTPVGALIVRY